MIRNVVALLFAYARYSAVRAKLDMAERVSRIEQRAAELMAEGKSENEAWDQVSDDTIAPMKEPSAAPPSPPISERPTRKRRAPKNGAVVNE